MDNKFISEEFIQTLFKLLAIDNRSNIDK